MADIMLNFANLLKKANTADGLLIYADSTSISSWAIDGVKYCQVTKVITGREGGSFAPYESATRAEEAIVIKRFIKINVVIVLVCNKQVNRHCRFVLCRFISHRLILKIKTKKI
ncbi:hypothetical protein DSECCO2_257800 [anaerobic digester metagenome]